jgi:hypothetical protein
LNRVGAFIGAFNCFNPANGQFRITYDGQDGAWKRETFGMLFDLSKVRCFGALANKGDPHLFRNGGATYAIDHFNVITDGVNLVIGFVRDGVRNLPTTQELKSQPTTIIPTHPAGVDAAGNQIAAGFDKPGIYNMSK